MSRAACADIAPWMAPHKVPGWSPFPRWWGVAEMKLHEATFRAKEEASAPVTWLRGATLSPRCDRYPRVMQEITRIRTSPGGRQPSGPHRGDVARQGVARTASTR